MPKYKSPRHPQVMREAEDRARKKLEAMQNEKRTALVEIVPSVVLLLCSTVGTLIIYITLMRYAFM